MGISRLGFSGFGIRKLGIFTPKPPLIPPSAAPSFITLQISGVSPTLEISLANKTFEVSH